MKKIEAFTREQLENQEIFKKISEKVEYLLRYDTGLPGDELIEFNILRIRLEEGLRKFGSQIDQDLYKKYLDFLIKISFIKMVSLSEEKIIDLFRKHFLSVLKTSIENEISLEDKIKAKVFNIPHMFRRDPFLRDLKQALKENIETLGENPISIGSRGKPQKPSIRNWLLDYNNVAGAGEHREIDISNYLFKSKNVRNLNTEEKKILKKILVLYERLKLDMFHPNSFSVYPLSLFDIKAVGSGLDQQYLPVKGTAPVEGEKKSFGLTKKQQEVKEERIPEREIERIEKERAYRRAKVVDKTLSKPELTISDIEKEKKEKFSHLTPIPKSSLAKLSTPTSLINLSLEDFRSFGADAKGATDFLLSKMKKMYLASPLNREAAKHYLRQSELYKIYLSQGKESLDLKKSIVEVAKIREEKGRQFLTEGEFKALREMFRAI